MTVTSGVIFAIGLAMSGMTDANKVIAFLNPLGGWDPSLAFVMVGAIGAHLATRHFIIKRSTPPISGIKKHHTIPHIKNDPLGIAKFRKLFSVGRS